VEIRYTGLRGGERAPLLERGHDVDEDGGFDARGWRGGCEQAVADSRAAVVGDPVDWAAGFGFVLGEDLLEGFEDGEPDLAFVEAATAREAANAVAGELGDEEGEVVFPGG
jgi:hypothetical protein